MSGNNYGISTGGGSVSAQNIAVGEGATISVRNDVLPEVLEELSAIRELVASSDVPDEVKSDVVKAVATLETEAKTGQAKDEKVKSALGILDQATKVGGNILEFGIKLAPHVATLAARLT